MRRLLPIAAILLVLASPAGAADRLVARLEPTSATVGDRVRAEVELSLDDAGARAEPPELEVGDHWGEAEVLSRDGGPTPSEGDPTGWHWTLEIAAFQPGSLELPPLTAVVPGPEPRTVAMETPLTLEIRSVLPAEGEVEPRPPTPPQRWPGISPWWWIAGGLALLALAAALFWWRRRRRPSSVMSAKAPRPLDALRAELEALAELDDAELAHTRLSIAVRRYLERRLGFPAAEHTTREIRRDLRSGTLPATVQRDLLEILAACDGVKFARRDDGLDAARARARTAGELAEAIEEALRPPEPPEEAAA